MRLIDADALVKELTRPTGLYADCERCSWSISNECMDCIVEDVIKHMPTIEPVKRGEWLGIGKHHIQDWQMVNKCSACGHAVTNSCCVDSVVYFKFCPHCGAKMDGEVNA